MVLGTVGITKINQLQFKLSNCISSVLMKDTSENEIFMFH